VQWFLKARRISHNSQAVNECGFSGFTSFSIVQGYSEKGSFCECYTVTIGEHTSDILPREYGVFNAVILRLDEGDGYQIRVDEPGSKWNGWVMSPSNSSVLIRGISAYSARQVQQSSAMGMRIALLERRLDDGTISNEKASRFLSPFHQ
jgi:hypothetical protein